MGPGEIAIQGNEEDIRALEDIIRQIDQGVPPPVTEVIQLKNAQAEKVAPQLTALFQQITTVPGRTARPEDKVTIVADTRSNSLIVAAAPERLAQVRDIVQKLDTKPMIGQVDIKTFLLKHIQASEAASTLSNVVKTLMQARGATAEQIQILPDDRTNSLLITAPAADLPQIEGLIGSIDVPPAFASAEMVIYSIHNVPAKDLATVLSDLISQAGRTGTAAPAGGAGGAKSASQTILRFKLRTAEGKELPELNLEKPIRIVPEPNTNSLVISTTPDNLKAMSDIIKLLDAFPVAEGVRVWVFPLQYADATELTALLKSAFTDGRNIGLRNPPQGTTPVVPIVPVMPESPAGKAVSYQRPRPG